jgi:hypothetical protein
LPQPWPAPNWKKSNRCDTNACVEAARVGDEVLVRKSTDPTGSVISFSQEEWVAFLGGVVDGDFDFGLVPAPASAGS